MSLYSALFSGVSGLSAQSSAMAAVSDNITNINTIGYKAVESQFSTLVGDGKAGGTYMAGGVTAAPKALISKQGLLQASSRSTDLGIDGQGFFVTRTGLNDTSEVSLTRAGSFTTDKEGYLKNSSGLYLQGWRLDALGGYVNTGSVESLEPIRVNDLSGTAAPTTKLGLKANFPSTTTAYAGAEPYDAAGDMASGAVTPQFKRSVDVFDGQGGTHRIAISAIKTGPNTWKGEVYAQPTTDVTQAGGLLASGTIAFNGDGSLNLAGSTAALFGSVTPLWSNGSSSQPIDLDFGTNGGTSGFTQFGGEESAVPTVNGGMLGNVASISVSKTGQVSAVFEDGTSRAVFQLPVATVANPDGLTRTTGNGYSVSALSGSYAINPPDTQGGGTITAFSLEASTADLAQEFTDMIRFQRAYSASSKIITTVDDMLQEVSNLKR